MAACKESTSLITEEEMDRCCPPGRCSWLRQRLKLSPKVRVGLIGGSWNLLTGIERVIILPTLWLYLNRFSSSTGAHFYGATLAGFNLLPLVCNPLFGWLSQKQFVRVRLLLVVANLLELTGNFIYFSAPAPALVFVGRLIAGAGSAAEPPLYADVVRVTTEQERTTFIVHLLLLRQIGIIAGPALTLLMHPIEFKVDEISVNVYNSPGLFMAFLWAVHTIAVILIYPDIKHEPQTPPEEAADAGDGDAANEKQPALQPKHKPKKTIGQEISDSVEKYIEPHRLKLYTRIEVFSLVFICFAGYFCLLALESVLSPLLSRLFHWDEFNISLVYFGCGIEVVIIYVAFRLFLGKQQERFLLLLAICLMIGTYFMNFGLLIHVDPTKPALYISLLLVSIVIQVLGLTATAALPESLFTKVVPPSEMDMAQGIYRTAVCLSMLFGPLLGGGLHTIPWVVFLVLDIAMAICLVLILKSYSKLDFPCEADNWAELEKQEKAAAEAEAAAASAEAADTKEQTEEASDESK